jgi:PKD repeat protein
MRGSTDVLIKRLFILGAAAALVGCSLDKQGAPSLTGPSELGVTLDASASPDILNQDGLSKSTVAIMARDATGSPVKLSLRVDIVVDGKAVDFGTLGTRSLTTNDTGSGSVTYTAPPEPPATVTQDTTVNIVFTPVGTNYANAVSRQVSLRLMRPGAIVAPSNDLSAVFTIAPTSPKIGDAVVFDASTSSAGTRGILSYQWDFGDGETGTGKVTSHPFTEAGTFAVRLTITDDLGRTATSSQTIAVGANLPKAAFTVSPTDPFVAENITFNAKSSTAGIGRGIVDYSWDFGDGSAPGSGSIVTHPYAEHRNYTVVLTVTDDLGQENSTSATITVNDLHAAFTVAPSSPKSGTSVKFDASSSKVPSGVTYEWDFGDGTTPAIGGPSISYIFAAPGTYTVVLSIHDTLGHTATASQTVTVTAP